MQHFPPLLLLFLIAAAPATKPALKPTFPAVIREQIKKSLDDLQSSADFPAAESQLQKIFDQTIAYSLPKDSDVIRDADFALRMVHQLQAVTNKDRRLDLFKFLHQSETLARTLVFLINPNQDPANVYTLLDRLRP